MTYFNLLLEKMNPLIEIPGRKIGIGQPTFIIAEAGVNHNGSLTTARQLVDIAVEAGADAVKFQSFVADLLVTVKAPKADYQLETTDSNETQFEMLRKLELDVSDHWDLLRYCHDRGILFMSTPCDYTSADLLSDMNVELFKIGSGELTNLPFLAYVARKGKPMIVSTGMGNLGEVESALNIIKAHREDVNNPAIVLLQCVSNYPAEPNEVNLRAMGTMERAFNVPVGYSDHTIGTEVPLASVALGACVVEKHLTLDRNLPGPDHRSSLEPDDFAYMVRGIRTVEAALGHGVKEPGKRELNTAAVARKSLVAAADILAGTSLSEGLISIKRPGNGLPPAFMDHVINRKTNQHITEGTPITLDMLI